MPDKTCTWPGCDRGGKIRVGLCGLHYKRMQTGVPMDKPERMAAKGKCCSYPGCADGAVARGLCMLHWQRSAHGVDMDRPRDIPSGARCRAANCDELGRKRGLCPKHYTRLIKHGSVDADFRRPRTSCSVDHCERPSYARGMCTLHARREKAGKPLDAPLRVVGVRVPCAEDGCNDQAKKEGGYCRRHTERQRYAAAPEQFKARVSLRRSRTELGDEDRAVSLAYRLAIADDPCTYCGASDETEVDHVFPLALGGTDHWWNLTRACVPCNRRKYAHCGTWWHLKRGSWATVDAAA